MSPRRKPLPVIDTTTKNTRFEEQDDVGGELRREDDVKAWKPSKSDVSPPTPGVDDTPYIQFAIDQLTRDEELMGHRRIGVAPGNVSPISEDEGLATRDEMPFQQPGPFQQSDSQPLHQTQTPFYSRPTVPVEVPGRPHRTPKPIVMVLTSTSSRQRSYPSLSTSGRLPLPIS